MSANSSEAKKESEPLLRKPDKVTAPLPPRKDPESQKPDEGEPSVEKNNTTLIVAFCLMLVFQLGNRIFGKLETVVRF
jgi:hypothetical protein